MTREDKTRATQPFGMLDRRGFIAITAATGAAALHSATAFAAEPEVVDTTGGRVRGGSSDGVRHFLGLPYGASTGGANRFLPPRLVAPWPGVREATQFGNSAPQTNPGAPPIDNPVMAFFPRDPKYVAESEDCLRLNVWTPSLATDGKRPVMVWLHGGGFAVGSASWPVYDGASFARTNDAVVISVNHRLNMFGYSYLADALGPDYRKGNVGQLDIVAALRWVRDNIAAFGGDPNNVTIRGQSGGGGKVSVLLAMPEAHGLFHKAIIESGPGLRAQDPDKAAAAAAKLVSAVGGKDKLLSASQDELMRAYFAMQAAQGAMGGLGPGFTPVVEGVSLPRHPYDPDATPLSANVPLLIGRTHHESAMFMMGRPVKDDAAVLAVARQSAPAKADAVVAAYRAAHPGASFWEQAVLIGTDSGTGLRTRELADRKSVQPAPVYVYRFDWETKVMNGAFRAAHGVDTSFIFNNTAIDPFLGGDPTARALADKVTRSWAAFMRSGSPEARGGLGPWPRYSASRRSTMLISNASHVEPDPDGELLDLFL
jgi:para-nitrobenzyl esterase